MCVLIVFVEFGVVLFDVSEVSVVIDVIDILVVFDVMGVL